MVQWLTFGLLSLNVLPTKQKIHIYNPDFERHGWQTTHTVVELICEDMPFIVDSMRMVINRMGISSHLIIHMGGIKVKRDKENRISAILRVIILW